MIGKFLPTLPTELHSIEYNDWSNYLNIKRNIYKENDLFYNVLNLKDNEEYIFINKMYGVNQIMKGVENGIIKKNVRVIDKSIINGYSLFDWSKVIENALEIHTVDTSINYLIETLTLKSEVLKLYPRNSTHTKNCLEKLFKTKWEWVD